MKIVVTSNEDPKYVREVDISSLDYNQKEGSFEIPAGGYIITSRQLFKALIVDFDNSKFNIVFEKLAEVEDFYNWIKQAESDAWDSYSRMLD